MVKTQEQRVITAMEAQAATATLPGLKHLRDSVQNWDTAVLTLSVTAAAIADSAGVLAKRAGLCSWQAENTNPPGATANVALTRPLLFSHPLPPPPLVVPAGQLKPGRVFVVANLQGAYYTLLELLSRNKFDFRCDNLLHVGNLVAPPSVVMARSGSVCCCGSGSQQPQSSTESWRVRNSAAVLKLIRRHGGLGPMGAHECLVLLTAAHCNRLRAQQQMEEKQRLAAVLARKLQQDPVMVPPAGSKTAFRATCSALSLQLAVTASASSAACPSQRAKSTSWLAAGSMGSDCSSSNDEDEAVEMVPVPMTPQREECAATPPPSVLLAEPGGGATISSPYLDNADLAQLLSLPACVVLEAYRVRLQHVGLLDIDDCITTTTAGSSDVALRYHTLFSHRRPGSGPGCSQTATTVTGLTSCRDVVRFAVLPPLRTLQLLSPGFRAKLAAAAAPSREELMLEVHEEPLSELDMP
ncbi:hypothetical protein VOLCADRAFT_104099 [Volvox carteri f. nagariensis]|uniref:Uncharacterized protein n=1 Tax=Volvox carteri f. nagariensis TaxID=3068 RepID=D8TR86_VOLCA|nr:uncharacterized protein VOLCADRAFT_104099 [Volvox carteri f. nagariensis]EFJ49953.1 hypothetical protein VOLCADRAFT_104099 [Volvox carteri f. nagariensis]|eukprot:XP_002949018.1 hypothetical protein VOLCADRAFT_104099 [Volvox carteri f. nagariensis]